MLGHLRRAKLPISNRLKSITSLRKGNPAVPSISKMNLMHNWKSSHLGLEPWTSILQFCGTKSRILVDNIFRFILLPSNFEKKFHTINLHDSELRAAFMFLGDTYPNCFFTYNIIINCREFQREFELLHRKCS